MQALSRATYLARAALCCADRQYLIAIGGLLLPIGFVFFSRFTVTAVEIFIF